MLVARAARARPDLADRIAVAAVTGLQPTGGGYAKGYAKEFKGKEISCDQVQAIVNAAIAADPAEADVIINAVIQAAPMLADCIHPCPPTNRSCSRTYSLRSLHKFRRWFLPNSHRGEAAVRSGRLAKDLQSNALSSARSMYLAPKAQRHL